MTQKPLIHASKPSYCVSNWPMPPKYKVFLSSCETHWSKCVDWKYGNTCYIQIVFFLLLFVNFI